MTKCVDNATLTAYVEKLNMKIMSGRPSAAPAAMGIHSQIVRTQQLPFPVGADVRLFDDTTSMEEYTNGRVINLGQTMVPLCPPKL